MFTISLESQLAEAQKEYDTRQSQLNKAYCELNKRIYEHDTAQNVKAEITLQVSLCPDSPSSTKLSTLARFPLLACLSPKTCDWGG